MKASWAVTGNGAAGKSTMSKFVGTWRLLYSSGFASGGLGGRQPGPPAALLPVTLGQVGQASTLLRCYID